MKIGVMSDSHDHRPNICKALEIFKKRGVKKIIHAGDLISPFCVELFQDFRKNFFLCSGNNKGDVTIIQDMMKDYGEFYQDIGEFKIDGKEFALYHGTDEIVLNSLIYGKEKFDYIITGHTHKKMLKKFGKTILINPGEVYNLYNYPTIAVLDTEFRKVDFIHIQ